MTLVGVRCPASSRTREEEDDDGEEEEVEEEEVDGIVDIDIVVETDVELGIDAELSPPPPLPPPFHRQVRSPKAMIQCIRYISDSRNGERTRPFVCVADEEIEKD